jgi:hypothetical protein
VQVRDHFFVISATPIFSQFFFKDTLEEVLLSLAESPCPTIPIVFAHRPGGMQFNDGRNDPTTEESTW